MTGLIEPLIWLCYIVGIPLTAGALTAMGWEWGLVLFLAVIWPFTWLMYVGFWLAS